MKITKTFLMLSMVSVLMFTISLASAGDFRLNYGGSKIFTVATTGNVNASGTIAEQGILLSETYLALSGGAMTGVLSSNSNITTTGKFVGDGSFLTGITIADNSVNIAGENITSGIVNETYLPTTIYTIAINATKIAVGTIDEARLPTSIYTIALNASKIAVGTIDFARLPSLTNLVVSDYHNITGIPTCTSGQYLTFNVSGSGALTCVAESGADFTNVAYYNETVTWAKDQVFTSDINVTTGSSINLLNDSSSIRRGNTKMTIDSTGNVDFWLG